MRLIDADALLDFLDVGHLRPPTEICFSELMMKNIIELMPTVEAVPVKHGHWISKQDEYDENYVICSICGDEYTEDDLHLNSWFKQYFKYCPTCGAKMDIIEANDG